MRPEQRHKALKTLHSIWSRHEIAPIPSVQLNRLNDDLVSYLVRFWSHVSRWWDIEGAPVFKEEPPQGWAAVLARPAPKVAPVPHTVKERAVLLSPKQMKAAWERLLPLTTSVNFGRQFKIAAGGHLTHRQLGSIEADA